MSDFDRARNFYEKIFEMKVEVSDFGSFKMGIFPHKDTGGAIVQGEHYTPGPDGVVVYLNAEPDLQKVLDRVEKEGCKVLQSKKQISPEHGFMGLFIDS